jgi:hypothetical protein
VTSPYRSAEPIWHLQRGDGPLIATALHDGHLVREEVARYLALGEADRLREEDPFTGRWTVVAPTQVVGLRSRFQVDLNRPRENAVYRTPADAWGLAVWKEGVPEELFERSLAEYDRFYEAMYELFCDIVEAHGQFVVFDLHSYNHRRLGPCGPAADPQANPQVNVGTRTMNRRRWATVVDTLIGAIREFDFPRGHLDVRENVKFFGGNWPQWIHERFPETGVAVAIEFKKFFMDEWTGEPDETCLEAIRAALQFAASAVLDVLA